MIKEMSWLRNLLLDHKYGCRCWFKLGPRQLFSKRIQSFASSFPKNYSTHNFNWITLMKLSFAAKFCLFWSTVRIFSPARKPIMMRLNISKFKVAFLNSTYYLSTKTKVKTWHHVCFLVFCLNQEVWSKI